MRHAACALAVVAAASLAACQRSADDAAASGIATQPTRGSAQVGSKAQDQPPGTGLDGGLGKGTAAMGAASAPAASGQGSKNRTTGSSVGNR